MSIFLVRVIDKEVVILGGAGVLSDDELGLSQGQQGFHGGIILVAEVYQDIEIEFDEVVELRHHRFTEPVEVFIAEEVAGKLGEAIEGDLSIVDVADEASVMVFVLQFREHCIYFLIGVLVGNLAEDAYGACIFEGGQLTLAGHAVFFYVFPEEISFDVSEHKVNNKVRGGKDIKKGEMVGGVSRIFLGDKVVKKQKSKRKPSSLKRYILTVFSQITQNQIHKIY